MAISVGFLLKGTVWTVGGYGVGQLLRLGTNVVLARLLAPELFGIMLIINSLRMGIALFSDFGIAQNIVYNKNADNPDFYNTAWSLEIVRNIVLWLVCLAAAAPLADFYDFPILLWILPVSALSFVLSGFSSISRYLLQKRMQIAKLNTFEMIVALISSAAYILLAYLSPTIWALVLGGVLTSAVSMVGTYFLLPDVKDRFYISKDFAWEILHFGKWIFVSSVVYFLSMNYDRLYLGKVIPLDVLGVYGIARSISELLGIVILRLGNMVLFPLIASHSHMPRTELHAQLVSIRAKFLLLVAVGVSFLVVTADFAIKVLYDERYQAAGWMLPVMIIGSWFTVLANINDSTLLGLGKPSYSAIANSSKFAFLVIGLPLGFMASGMLGVVVIVAFADLCRYIPVFVGHKREHFSFGMQDFLFTILVFALSGILEWLRWASGFGTFMESMPLHFS